MDESECIAGLVVARILGEQEEQPSDLRAILLNRQIKSPRNRDIAGKSKGRCGTVWKAHRDPRKGHEGNDGRGGSKLMRRLRRDHLLPGRARHKCDVIFQKLYGAVA